MTLNVLNEKERLLDVCDSSFIKKFVGGRCRWRSVCEGRRGGEVRLTAKWWGGVDGVGREGTVKWVEVSE